jgi:HEPN domain-containing protein
MGRREHRSDIALKFLRAAEQRLATAEFLLKNAYYLDCMYLSGYGVECAMKALILSRTPRNRRAAAAAGFRGAKSHNFEHLKERLNMVNCPMSTELIAHLRVVASWTPQWRYETGLRRREDAVRFVVATRVILDWLKGRL